MAKRRVYKTFDDRWCSLQPGKKPRREYHDEPPDGLREIQPPPIDGAYPQERYFIGRRGQWRVTAHVEINWDRQGIHAVGGLQIGYLAITGDPGSMALAGLIFAGLVIYEIRESGAINDLDWLDLGGMVCGLMVVGVHQLWNNYQGPFTAAWQWAANFL